MIDAGVKFAIETADKAGSVRLRLAIPAMSTTHVTPCALTNTMRTVPQVRQRTTRRRTPAHVLLLSFSPGHRSRVAW